MKMLVRNKMMEPLNILLVGNNPIELSAVLEKLNQLRSRKLVINIAFDVKTILERLATFNPNFILIDDNIGRRELIDTVNKLSANRKTRNVPITVLKNSNYHEALASPGILDYILKQNISTDAIYNMVKNTLKFKRTQQYLLDAYKQRKKLIMKIQKRSLNLVS